MLHTSTLQLFIRAALEWIHSMQRYLPYLLFNIDIEELHHPDQTSIGDMKSRAMRCEQLSMLYLL